jgi:heme-degrading monooxygenase HmoA
MLMVLFVQKWNIRPEKAESYGQWTRSAIERVLSASGVVEVRAYRPVTGAHQVVITYSFADLTAWAAWAATEQAQNLTNEVREYVTDLRTELWGPSAVTSEPIRQEERT